MATSPLSSTRSLIGPWKPPHVRHVREGWVLDCMVRRTKTYSRGVAGGDSQVATLPNITIVLLAALFEMGA